MKCFADPQAQSVKSALFRNSGNYYRSHPYDFTTFEHPDTARLNFGRSKSFPQPFDECEIELVFLKKDIVDRVHVDIYSRRRPAQAYALRMAACRITLYRQVAKS
jgi:hypothetical protein